MKREVLREVRLPAFSLGRGELELLCNRMKSLFETTEESKLTINLSLPNEKLRFDSLEEFTSYNSLRGRVLDFSIKAERGYRSVTVKTGGLFSNVPTLRVEAESEVWCAGAIEAVMSIVRENRVWYGWLIRLPLTLIFLLLSLVPAIINWIAPKAPSMPIALSLTWFSAVLVFGYVSYHNEKLLPPASIVFTQELGFVRRYGAELGLALGVVSFMFAIYTWLKQSGA